MSLRWSPDDDATLRAMYRGKGRTRRAAERLHRTAEAVERRARHLGLTAPLCWTPAENETLRLAWGEYRPSGLRSKLPGRTWGAIHAHAKALGLPAASRGRLSVDAAARKAGFSVVGLLSVLAAASIRPERASTGYREHLKMPRRYVDAEALREAVDAWLASETINAAARRHGVSFTTLAKWLRAADLVPPSTGHHGHKRVPSQAIDAVVAAHRPALEQHPYHRRKKAA